MNLIYQIRNFFHRNGGNNSQPQLTESQEPSSAYKNLLLNLQQVCGRLPEGEAFVTIGNGEFSVSMTWKPKTEETAEEPLRFSLCGDGRVIEWKEKEPADAKEDTVKARACETTATAATVTETPQLPTRQQLMMQRLVRFLRLHYAFRYNRLTDRTECAKLDPDNADDTHHLIYTPVDNRALNSISLNAISHGIECWDRDVKRYIESDNAPAYHPFTEYFNHLPAWDGRDRVTELAKRVSDKPLWVKSFHRWMLAVTAQWMDFDGGSNSGKRANAVAPILVSTKQGLGKSTFCRMLLPKPLQEYFTESFDLTNASGAENKLASYGLINIDEFDRLPATRMPQLKNLMQMESLRIRRAYKRSAEPLPRIASFIGTSNRTDLLTDLSGSRRFICVEVTENIDCTTPLDYEQLYAQLKQELEQGERYWFSKEEEAEIQAENRAFYRVTPAEELVASCFRFAEPGEEGARMLSAADIYAVVKRKNPAALRDCTCTAFSRLLAQVGRRVHTRYGNGYWVASLG